MSFTHLSQDERCQIQHLHGGGFSAREIGIQLERAATTINRELRRNQAMRPSITRYLRTGRVQNVGARRACKLGSFRSSGLPWKRVW